MLGCGVSVVIGIDQVLLGYECYVLIIDCKYIQESLLCLENVNIVNLYELVVVCNDVCCILCLLGIEIIEEVLVLVIDLLLVLVSDFGKVVLVVQIDDNGYVVYSFVLLLLQNVFMYLICNVVDYGLELGEECLVKGKFEVGIIKLEMGVMEDMFQMVLFDDGCGLVLYKVCQIVIEKQFISVDQVFIDVEIVCLIL